MRKKSAAGPRPAAAPRHAMREIRARLRASAAPSKKPAPVAEKLFQGEPRVATIDDLRALDNAARTRLVDFITSGVPIKAIRDDLRARQGFLIADDAPVVAFYQEEARQRWQNHFDTASADAESVLNILRHSNLDFSEALLKALGQETFRMITQRELDCKQIEKFTRLLLQARAQDNAKEALELQRVKVNHQVKTQMEKALTALAEEIGRYPDARALFEALCVKLREHDGADEGGEAI